MVNLRRVKYDLIFNFSQSLESFFFALIGKSVKKSILIYLSRYGNPNFSKIVQRIITKIFSIDYITIDRIKYFENKLNFHQTEIMYQLVKRNLKIKKPKSFHLISSKKEEVTRTFQERILIHLSERWIDNEYSEGLFLDLLQTINKKFGKIYLTTDKSSYKS